MHAAISGIWILIKFLNIASFVAILSAIIIFARNLHVTTIARRNDSSDALAPAIWRSPRARFSFKLMLLGAALQLASIALAIVVPGVDRV